MKRLLVALAVVLISTRWCMPAHADDAGFLWAYALHDSFSQDTFYSADFTKPFGQSAPIRPFGELMLQRDSRTTAGIVAQTLNDNYGLLAGGIQFETEHGLRAFVQVGTSFDFGPPTQGLPSSSHFDARAGVQYYRDRNDPPEGPNRYYGAFFADLIYYTRYQNALMYFEAQRGREFGSRNSPVQYYIKISGSQDSRRLYYNDVVAFSTGAQILPLGRRGLALGVEEAFSVYTSSAASLGYGAIPSSYWSFRPQITYGATF
jgi:hypothetical protein